MPSNRIDAVLLYDTYFAAGSEAYAAALLVYQYARAILEILKNKTF